MPTMLEITQYRASPAGNAVVKNPNIMGIIHSIMRLVDACLGSADGMVVVFCMRNMDTPTRMGRRGVGSGCAKSSHRNELSTGIWLCTIGSQE